MNVKSKIILNGVGILLILLISSNFNLAQNNSLIIGKNWQLRTVNSVGEGRITSTNLPLISMIFETDSVSINTNGEVKKYSWTMIKDSLIIHGNRLNSAIIYSINNTELIIHQRIDNSDYLEYRFSCEKNQDLEQIDISNISEELNSHRIIEDSIINVIDNEISYNPDSLNLYFLKANRYIELKQIDSAIEMFDFILLLHPDNSNALCLRGWSKCLLKNFESGCDDLYKSKNLGNARTLNIIKKYCR